jgi:hypothetical protein
VALNIHDNLVQIFKKKVQTLLKQKKKEEESTLSKKRKLKTYLNITSMTQVSRQGCVMIKTRVLFLNKLKEIVPIQIT